VKGARAKALDLFCGLGGWSDGLVMEGFEVLGVEIEPKIAELYKHPCLIADVRELDGRMFKTFDFIVGSPPCRDFTVLQDVTWKEKKNPRRGLKNVHAFLRIIDEAKPKFWLMENVPLLQKYLNQKGGTRYLAIKKRMKRCFWGNYPMFDFHPTNERTKFMQIGKAWDPMRRWERARIPLPVARALGKAVGEALD